MTDEHALLAAMASDPADDTVRLAYADFLEEKGESDRGEFVRVQVELSRTNGNDLARRALVVRHVKFLQEYVPRWRTELPQLPGIEWGDFNRGLVEEVQAATEQAVVKHAAVIFAQPAIHVLRLVRLVDPLRLATVPELIRLRSLRLISARAFQPTLRVLLASMHLRHLSVLDLHGNRAEDAVAADIADGRFPELAELWLGSNRIGDAGVRSLANSSHLKHLRLLDLSGNRITDIGARTALAGRFKAGLKL